MRHLSATTFALAALLLAVAALGSSTPSSSSSSSDNFGKSFFVTDVWSCTDSHCQDCKKQDMSGNTLHGDCQSNKAAGTSQLYSCIDDLHYWYTDYTNSDDCTVPERAPSPPITQQHTHCALSGDGSYVWVDCKFATWTPVPTPAPPTDAPSKSHEHHTGLIIGIVVGVCGLGFGIAMLARTMIMSKRTRSVDPEHMKETDSLQVNSV